MQIKEIFSKNNLAIQKGESTCGPVALLNILHLKNNFSYSEEELAKLCKTIPGYGTTPKSMIQTAKHLGLNIIEEKENANLENIRIHVDNGAYVIVLYTTPGGNGHYTVVTEYDEHSLYCRDSAFGFLTYPNDYLDEFWHGVEHDASKNSKRWLLAVK